MHEASISHRRVAPEGFEPAPRRIPVTSRTRRVFGVFNLGAELVVVYASRSSREAAAVTVEVGDGAQRLAGDLSPAQARALARALVAAAEATEGAQRRPSFERYAAHTARAEAAQAGGVA